MPVIFVEMRAPQAAAAAAPQCAQRQLSRRRRFHRFLCIRQRHHGLVQQHRHVYYRPHLCQGTMFSYSLQVR